MARRIVERIDRDPGHAGLEKARATCSRWFAIRPEPAIAEWLNILQKPWEEIRTSPSRRLRRRTAPAAKRPLLRNSYSERTMGNLSEV